MNKPKGHLGHRLARSLERTHARKPRPVTPLELPLGMDHLLKGRWMKRLKPAAVLVGVRRGHSPSVILTVRSEHLRAHSGQISFPGGRAEPDEDFPVETALREAEEEIGLDPAAVEVFGYLDDYPTITKYRVTPVVGFVAADAEVHSESDEVGEVFEVPLSFVLDRANYSRRSLARLGRPMYYELNYGRYRIWGATAGMLYNMQEKFARHEMG